MTMPDTVPSMPAAGDAAPDFTGKTQDGKTIRLRALRGRKVALYFYPKDDTPGCTRQACNLRDEYQDLLEAGISVLGVSPDDEASHSAFARKYGLPFPLLADPEKAIITRYGVWKEKNLYGVKKMRLHRTTFLIDEDGMVVHVLKRPKVDEHARQIMGKFGMG